MKKRAATLLSRIWNPEIPLFGVGLMAAAVICLLTAVIVWSTFLKGLPGFSAPFTLDNYTDVFFYPVTPQALRNTLILGFGTVAVAIFFALPAAWLLHRTNVPFKKFFLTLMFLHVLLPGFLRVMGWIMLISPEIGIINQWIRIFISIEEGPLSPYNLTFMAFLQGLSLTPTLFFMLAGAFLAIDPSFEESSEVCGASRVQSLRRIALPLVMPALVAGAIYVFMTAISMFEVPALLGKPLNINVFSTLMYSAVYPYEGLPNYGIAGVYGVMLLIPTLVALRYYQRMLKLSHRFATVTGKGYRPKLTPLGRWQWAATGFILFYYAIDLFLPFFSVLWTSLVPRLQVPSISAMETVSLAGYKAAIRIIGQGGVLANTLQLVLTTGVLSVFIGLIISWSVLRTRLPGRYLLDTIAMLPHAVPGMAFAFSVAFVSLLLAQTVPLYGSVSAIALADAMRRIPFATRTISTSLIQIHPELEEAVQISGGSRVVAIRKVLIPLITPSLFYSFIWAVLHAYREVTMALFLQSPRNLVMATAIWQRWQTDDTSSAAAIGVIMVLGMGVVIFALLWAFPQVFGAMRRGHIRNEKNK
ncbi:MAG: iron ABC transporter permease [Desulfobacterales bacterium]|nr:iron ABC transporter permease [Desulfobacterales bacterium]